MKRIGKFEYGKSYFGSIAFASEELHKTVQCKRIKFAVGEI